MISAERFWERVEVGEPDECWEWRRARKDGYGWLWVGDGQCDRAHRVAWLLTNGEIPADLPHVLHHCDNPPCCNPEHLFVGTNADNVADMCAKARQAAGDRSGARLHPERLARGEANGAAKLTWAQAAEIRTRRRAGGETGRALAAEFGVSPMIVSKIARGILWKEVPDGGGRRA